MSEWSFLISLVAFAVIIWQGRRISRLEYRVETLVQLELTRNRVPTQQSAATETQAPDAPEPQESPASTAWGGVKAPPAAPKAEPKGPGMAARALAWLTANWIYPLAGIALFFAALYLVQYSIERNLISPSTRIMLAALFGVALMAGGEALRRRWPDDAAGHVPATLAGAGVAVLFVTPLAAFHLYDLIGQGTCLLLLALIALGAVALGWVHGAFLTAFGVLAGTAAPFLLGEAGAPRDLLYGYFGVIGAAGLLIDGYRRWIWVSILSVLAPLIAGLLIFDAGADMMGFFALGLVLTAMAAAMPYGKLVPHDIDDTLWPKPGLRAVPVLLGVVLASLTIGAQSPFGLGVILLPLLGALIAGWTWRASGQTPLGAIPLVTGVLFLLAPVATPLATARIAALNEGLPLFPYLVVGLSLLAGVIILARPTATAASDTVAISAPAASVIMLDLFWGQSDVTGASSWAFVAMGMAAVYTFAAMGPARGNPLRQGLALVAAYALIALSLVLLLSDTALTVALAVQIIAAVLIDRRLNLPVLALAYAAASLGLVWNVLFVQHALWLGYPNGQSAPTLSVVVTCAVMLFVPACAWVLGLRMPANRLRGLALTAVSATMALLIPSAVYLLMDRFADGTKAHAFFGVQLSVVAVMCAVSFWRAKGEDFGALKWAYRVIGGVQALTVTGLMAVLLSLFHPFWGILHIAQAVRGWVLMNDLLFGYLLPAGVLLALSRRVQGLASRVVFGGGVAMLLVWGQLAIRQAWQGGDAMRAAAGMGQGELYTYTVALLMLGAVFLVLAMRTGAQRYRYLSLGIIGVAACKAFLIDASGLSGLMRVGAFLGLGLSLVALAWLNGRIAARRDPS